MNTLLSKHIYLELFYIVCTFYENIAQQIKKNSTPMFTGKKILYKLN